jgi:hypothetical protein
VLQAALGFVEVLQIIHHEAGQDQEYGGPGEETSSEDQPLAQQQLRQPMPGPQQIRGGVFAGSDQVSGCLLGLGRDPHPRQLPDVQQPGQPFGVAPVGLDPIPGRAFQLGRRHHHTAHPGRLKCPASPNPVGPASSATPTGQRPHQLRTASVAGGSRNDHSCPVALSPTPATIDRACTSRPTDVRSSTIRRLP